MCGISLIARLDGALTEAEVDSGRRITAAMARRGPDGEGHWVSGDRRFYLGHRRLAVIDLSERAAQPMHWAERGLHISYNGEIYNYRALRAELEGKGHRFVTQSDTEVILHGYGEWGSDVLCRLRGMFAFAIRDEKRDELFIARDPYGIKPLYYTWDNGIFRAASQVKALLAGGGVEDRADPAGWVGFLLFGWVPEPWTTCTAIKTLPAGSWLRATPRGIGMPQCYASLASVLEKLPERKDTQAQDDLVREALRDSVRAHLVADVPVGAFLSAGVDSGTLVALMREAGYEDIRTVTLGFEEFRGTPEDEVPLAEEVARRYGTQHTTRIIGRKEFLADWPRILQAMDQPSVDGANTWLVSKVAQEAGLKVVVSGVGGDELLGGYSSFRQIPRWVRTMRRFTVVPLAARTGYLAARAAARWSPRVPAKLPAVLRDGHTFAGAYFARRGLFMPWELKGLLEPDFIRAGLRELAPLEVTERALEPAPATALGKVMALESALYLRNQLLRDADWASMDHSLELRTPLVDWRLWQQLGPALAARSEPGKAALAAAPTHPLESRQVQRPKTGFGLPLGPWLGESMTRGASGRQGAGSTSRALASRLAANGVRSSPATRRTNGASKKHG